MWVGGRQWAFVACMPVCVWNLSTRVWGAAHDVAGCERCRAERVAAACGLRLLRGPFWTGWGRRAGRALNALPGLLSLQAGAASYLEQRRQLLHLAVWRVGATAPLCWRWGGFRGGGACAPRAAPAYALGKFPPLCVALPEGGATVFQPLRVGEDSSSGERIMPQRSLGDQGGVMGS